MVKVSQKKKPNYTKLKGQKLGQTIPITKDRTIKGLKVPAGTYVKGGKFHNVDIARDARIIALKKRKPGSANYRGDIRPAKGVKSL